MIKSPGQPELQSKTDLTGKRGAGSQDYREAMGEGLQGPVPSMNPASFMRREKSKDTNMDTHTYTHDLLPCSAL